MRSGRMRPCLNTTTLDCKPIQLPENESGLSRFGEFDHVCLVERLPDALHVTSAQEKIA